MMRERWTPRGVGDRRQAFGGQERAQELQGREGRRLRESSEGGRGSESKPRTCFANCTKLNSPVRSGFRVQAEGEMNVQGGSWPDLRKSQ